MPTHGQSKTMSMVEAVVNTVVGLVISMVATAAICKAYGIPMTWENNFIITFWMTVLSVLRSYILRRLFNFNWLRIKTNVKRMAEAYRQRRRPRL